MWRSPQPQSRNRLWRYACCGCRRCQSHREHLCHLLQEKNSASYANGGSVTVWSDTRIFSTCRVESQFILLFCDKSPPVSANNFCACLWRLSQIVICVFSSSE